MSTKTCVTGNNVIMHKALEVVEAWRILKVRKTGRVEAGKYQGHRKVGKAVAEMGK